MEHENVTPPADPSHDDLSNPGPERNQGVPEFDNESHDRNDDPGVPAPSSERKQDPSQPDRGQNR